MERSTAVVHGNQPSSRYCLGHYVLQGVFCLGHHVLQCQYCPGHHAFHC